MYNHNGYSSLATHVSKAEQYALIAQAQSGNLEARNRLIETNLRLVCAIAHRVGGHLREEDRSDLIGEGVFGLIHAIGKFDPTRQLAFSTYAVPWIKQAIDRALPRHLLSADIPDYAWQQSKKLRRCLEQDPDATAVQLAERTGLALEQTSRLLEWMKPAFSLDAPAFTNADESYLDLLADTQEDVSYAQSVVESDAQQTLVVQCLALLSERERTVIEMYFGLNRQEAMDFREIGEVMGFSRQRAHQYHERAMRKIREGLGMKAVSGA